MSIVRSARGTVEIGFIAARTRSTSPVVMPPSVPPDRPVRAAHAVAGPRTISSCACDPRRRAGLEAVADLDALDRLDAHQRAGQPGVEPAVPVHVAAQARRQAVGRAPRRRRRGCRRPAVAASISATIAALVAGVDAAHRVGVDRARRRRGPGSDARRGVDRCRCATTWLRRPRRRAPARRNARATAPSATRAAVSRALARSSTGRASSKPYFCMPTRSAWPGRGPGQRRVAGQARPSSSASTGSADITVSHFGHSVLPTRIATGPPMRQPVPDAAERARPRPARTSSGRRGRSRAGAGPARRRPTWSTSHAGRQPLDDRDQGGAVRLPGGQPAQHVPDPPTAAAPVAAFIHSPGHDLKSARGDRTSTAGHRAATLESFRPRRVRR